MEQFMPAVVNGDGNCLFWTVSLALYGNEYGNESLYAYLRLLAADGHR